VPDRAAERPRTNKKETREHQNTKNAEKVDRQKDTHIKRIVVPKDELELGRKVAAGAGHEAEEDRGGCRRNT
jgi:hypothetical protein